MIRTPLVIWVLLSLQVAGLASDHNNLDKERPLRFEDAYSIAYRSHEFQNGIRLDSFRGSRPVYNFRSELQMGFAKNRDISIGFEPFISTTNGKLVGNIAEVSYFEGVHREIGNNPAFGYRIDAGLPLSGQSGSEIRVRGILTKTLSQFDKLHLNIDQYVLTSPDSRVRRARLAAIMGYSNPIGYPKRFDQTLLAEFGIEQGRQKGSSFATWVGVGLRKQVSATGVIDLGMQFDIKNGDRQSYSPLRLTVGYSCNF
jgi:hypothetical protein